MPFQCWPWMPMEGRGTVVSQSRKCNSISSSEICVKTVPFVFCRTFQPQNDRGSTIKTAFFSVFIQQQGRILFSSFKDMN